MKDNFKKVTDDDPQAWASLFKGSWDLSRQITPFEHRLIREFTTFRNDNDLEKPTYRAAALLVCLLPHPTADYPEGYRFYYCPYEHRTPIDEMIKIIKENEKTKGETTVIALDTGANSKPFYEQWPYPAGTVDHPMTLVTKQVISTPKTSGTNVVSLRSHKPL